MYLGLGISTFLAKARIDFARGCQTAWSALLRPWAKIGALASTTSAFWGSIQPVRRLAARGARGAFTFALHGLHRIRQRAPAAVREETIITLTGVHAAKQGAQIQRRALRKISGEDLNGSKQMSFRLRDRPRGPSCDCGSRRISIERPLPASLANMAGQAPAREPASRS